MFKSQIKSISERFGEHILVSCNALVVPLQHREAMPEISRGLSDQRERHPRKASEMISILEGCQKLCDLSEVVKYSASFGGVVAPLRVTPQPPANFLQPSGLPSGKLCLRESALLEKN